MKYFLLLCSAFFLLIGSPAFAQNESGLPIPRWVSIKSNEVNVRTGPGTRYPIVWVYRKEDLPVEVVEEFDLWRKIRDPQGETGWIHRSMLQGKRTVMITSKDAQTMRAEPEEGARAILKAEPTVIGRLIGCEGEWCRLQMEKYKGWLPRKVLWGVYEKEDGR